MSETGSSNRISKFNRHSPKSFSIIAKMVFTFTIRFLEELHESFWRVYLLLSMLLCQHFFLLRPPWTKIIHLLPYQKIFGSMHGFIVDSIRLFVVYEEKRPTVSYWTVIEQMHVANMFKGKRHQNDVDDIVLVALLLAFNIFTYSSIVCIFDFDEQVVNIYWASTFQ